MASPPPALLQALNRAFSAYNAGKFDEAEKICQQLISAKHDFFHALHLLAVVQLRLGKKDAALASYDRALAVQPDNTEALYNRGNTLKELKRFDEALASYDRALDLQPDNAEALSNRGNILTELKRFHEALASYDRALAVRPDFAEALNNRGNTLKQLKRLDAALASYDRALAVRPDFADALNNRGNTLKELTQLDEALASYDVALTVQPANAEVLSNRGAALQELKRLDEALASYDRALALRPDYAEALSNRGVTLQELKRFNEALASCDRALAVRPDFADALSNRGNILREQGRLEEALASYDRALVTKPDHVYAFSGAADCVIKVCDWGRRTRFATDLTEHVSGQKSIITPFVLLGYSSDPALQLQCAKNYVEHKFPLLPQPFWTGEAWRHDKLRVAYLSADFRNHAMAQLSAELYELHDRKQFEVMGVSFGPDDRSDIRARLKAAFDHFHDVREVGDRDVAKLLHDLHVDIAVDLSGYTNDSRPGIFAHRPAPIQVSFLGYPGTSGADFIDYFIGDPIVLPFDQQPYYTEKIVHLPDSFIPTDSKQSIAREVPSRGEVGLPEEAFVFCSFSESYKINPAIFDIWMRLLRNVEGSVLWLLHPNETAMANLRREAEARGVAADRLIFAPRLGRAEHLARISLGDLFLNTHPVNAGANAIDALSVGLPIVTTLGDAFVERVTASLLHAVGLQELVVEGFAEYEALALQLARDPARLSEIKGRLARNRESYPLFNTERFTRHIEAAYTTMWKTWQRGEAPHSFSVEPIQ